MTTFMPSVGSRSDGAAISGSGAGALAVGLLDAPLTMTGGAAARGATVATFRWVAGAAVEDAPEQAERPATSKPRETVASARRAEGTESPFGTSVSRQRNVGARPGVTALRSRGYRRASSASVRRRIGPPRRRSSRELFQAGGVALAALAGDLHVRADRHDVAHRGDVLARRLKLLGEALRLRPGVVKEGVERWVLLDQTLRRLLADARDAGQAV